MPAADRGNFRVEKNRAAIVVAAVMGLTWLGTVPLTSGLVAKVFGVCFLSHQIGSFLGAWSGGFVFDLTGSYSLVWAATAVAGLLAAALHFPIDDTVADVPVITPDSARA